MNIPKAFERLANIAFLLLFPGFMIYHQLIAMNVIPKFVEGLFGPIAVLVIIIYVMIFSLTPVVRLAISPYISVVFIFVIYCFWITIFHFLSVNDYVSLAIVQSFTVIVQWVALFIVGFHLRLESVRYLKLIILGFLCLVTLLLFIQYMKSGVVVYNARNYFENESIATYEGFARSASVSLILVMALTRNTFGMLPVWLMGSMLLLMLGARSDFFAFIFLLPLILLLEKRRKRTIIMMISASVLILPYSIKMFLNSRHNQVLNLSESSSWHGRTDVFHFALNQIMESPITGQFGGHFFYAGGSGSFAHNIFSAWVSYGIIGFIIYVYLIAVPTINSFYYMLKGDRNPTLLFCFLLSSFCIVLLISSKSVFWPVPALIWGSYCSISYTRKNIRKKVYINE